MKQNDRFIVRLSGEMTDNRARLMALLDLLPAGFEIEGAVQRKDDGSTIYPFLPVLASANVTEARDDRFVTTFDIGSNYQPTDPKEIAKQRRPTFNFAYIVRATVPGLLHRAGRDGRRHVRPRRPSAHATWAKCRLRRTRSRITAAAAGEARASAVADT